MGPSPGLNRGPRALMLWVNPWRYWLGNCKVRTWTIRECLLSANHTGKLLVDCTI